MKRLAAAILTGVLAFAAHGVATASAQDFPSRPIQIFVPWPPGAVDNYIRFLQPHMEKQLGKTLIIENKPGANGYLGTEQVMRAKPDGYTLLFNVTSSIVMGPLTSPDARFDVQKNFTPVTDVFVSPMVMVVRNALPVQNLQQFIDYAKSNSGKLNFGSPGNGSIPHLLGETLNLAAGIKMTHVPYKGFAPGVQALIANELDMAFVSSGTIQSQIVANRVRPIAIDAGQMATGLAPVPDLTKALPGFETVPTFAALWAPAGTPKAIVDRLNEAAVAALRIPEVRARIEDGGQVALGGSPAQVAERIAKTVEISTRLVNAAKAAGVRFD
jgi:tripartite-type tricarboxylate transporter receptor subunit TctC